jgi:nucleoside-diphosphate-sugar epimerase
MNKIVREDIQTILSSNLIEWSRFENKTILITGASGMLPSYMALTLFELNRQHNLNIHLLLLVRNREKAERVFADYINEECFKFIVQDVSDPIQIEGHVDFIVHAASQASPKYYGIDPVGTANANIIGTRSLLELAKVKHSESLLFFSSSTIYGALPSQDIIIPENLTGSIDPINIRNCYSESKRMAENMCASYAYQYNVPAKIIRIFHTLGPNMNINDGRAFSDFCKAIIERKDIVLRSEGNARRTFLYVTDAIVAYFLVLLNGKNGEAYNVGSTNQEVSMRELSEELTGKIYSELGLKVCFDIDKSSLTYSKMKNPIDRILPNTDKLKSLGWTESVDYATAFKRTIDSRL